MGRRKKSDLKEPRISFWSNLQEETRHGIFGVLFFTFGLFFLLAKYGYAGLAGNTAFTAFDFLFGEGYLLVPIVLILIGVSFFMSVKPNFVIHRLIGGLFLFISLLGSMNIILNDETIGGLIGRAISGPLLTLFDFYISLVVLLSIGLISIFIIFDSRLTFEGRLFGLRLWGKKEDEEEDLYSAEPMIASQEDEDEEEEEEDLPKNKIKEKIKEPEPVTENGILAGIINFNKKGNEVTFTPPPLNLLSKDSGKPGVGDIKANSNIIKRTLANFGINVEMDEISIGPSITRYALKPAEGVKLSRIINLQNDLALALAAHPIRIEAPIPGKSLVGIEIPNTTKTTVGLGSILGSKEFSTSSMPLLIGLGRSISGSTYFSNLAKAPHLLIAGATGSGKTCAKDTYVFSEKGILTFEELCPLPLNSEINYSLKVATRDGIETTSKNYNNGICDFYKLTTAEGLSIEVTEEHPLWVIKDGVMNWLPGGEVKLGEYVAIARGSDIFSVDKEIKFTPKPNKTNKARQITLPTKMSKDLGLFMGLLSADGGLTIGHRVVYTQANKIVLNIYLNLLDTLFDIKKVSLAKSGSSNKAKDVVVNSKNLKDFLNYLGLDSSNAQHKEIPLAIRQSSRDTIIAYIQGLIRNDGHISLTKGMEITLANYKLLQQLQIILLNFGIVSGLHPKKVKNYEHNEYWRLTVCGGEFVKYAEKIGFLTKEEKLRAKLLLTLHRNSNKDVIPSLSPVLNRLKLSYRQQFARLTNNGWAYQEKTLIPKYAFHSLTSYNSDVRMPSYDALGKILDFYKPISDEEEYQTIEKINHSNFYWAKVTKIEKTSGEGYDFEVPGSHSFVGNGFVNHNSVTIHTLITSLLYRNPPERMRFIMIDPKRVELTMYNKIPHLLTPVITDSKKAIVALRWAAKEMERRYGILEEEAVRDIQSYHSNILEPKLKAKAKTDDDEDVETMPYIVIIIDELADIMSTYPRELEAAVVRLAQMSRAVGIHLVLSTQRPSVEVITGLIKANIPARVALQVASQIDSRTIIDSPGAEKLLGAGDMLYLSGEMSKAIRLQSAFISETEVKRVVKYITDQYIDLPPDTISLDAESNHQGIFSAGIGNDSGDDDDLYEDARQAVVEAGKASASYLQRKLKVGYARAARLLDMLEERGIVGPGDGAKPREVYAEKPSENYD